MPLISVIVPVYKVEEYLRGCIESILKQSFSDFELILIDDGSPDNCGAICDEYAKKDGRVRVIHQENAGQASARNCGLKWILEHSDSKFVSFIDSDDWVHERYLELLLKGIKNYSADMSQCLFSRVSDRVAPNIQISEEVVCVSPDEQYVNWYNPFFWGKLFKKEQFETVRFPEGKIFEDVLIWYKVLFSYTRIAIIKDVLYFYFQRAEGTTLREWSPAKLTQIEAWDEQLAFATNHGSYAILRAVLNHYFKVLKRHYREIDLSSCVSPSEKSKYRRQLKQKMRRLCWAYAGDLMCSGLFLKVFSWSYLINDRAYYSMTKLYQRLIHEE